MSATGTTAPREPFPALDRSRPFGAHLRMSWWTPLVLLTVPALVIGAGVFTWWRRRER